MPQSTTQSVTLPEFAQQLFDRAEFAVVATIEPNGMPQQSVVWVKRDGDDVLFSTTRGRRKVRNLEADPRASVLVYPKDAPYSYVEVRGDVTIEDDPEGALIEELSQKYTGQGWVESGPVERVIVRIAPRKVAVFG